jgi:hypothetical protein
MTAEIVIMNRQGVALAADSAVTLGDSKIFNTAEKLFMLAPNYPVGILIYNNATFMTLPWEIIIKAYKDHILARGIRFERIEQYGDDFIAFLKTNEKKFVTPKQQEHVVSEIVETVFDGITKRIWKKLELAYFQTSEKITAEQVVEETKKAIKSMIDVFEKAKDLYVPDEVKNVSESFLADFGEIIQETREGIFDKIPLDDDDIENLNKLCTYLLTKDRILSLYSGIVFVGFGEDDLLPGCAAYIFECFICGSLKCRIDTTRTRKIEFSGASVEIVPFAQDDVVQNFIGGAHPIYLNLLGHKLQDELKLSDSEVNGFLETLQEEMFDEYTNSIIQTVNALTKEDLAIMAQTLVNITSFMRKVSMSLETVGGPVDVAVISKQDGFIWIKKKRYFDPQDNLHYRHVS